MVKLDQGEKDWDEEMANRLALRQQVLAAALGYGKTHTILLVVQAVWEGSGLLGIKSADLVDAAVSGINAFDRSV